MPAQRRTGRLLSQRSSVASDFASRSKRFVHPKKLTAKIGEANDRVACYYPLRNLNFAVSWPVLINPSRSL
jgi:hypothetical protein